MKSFAETIHSFIKKYDLIAPGQTIIVGYSGGPDSQLLLHMLAHLQDTCSITIIAAHMDHGWRAESRQDALFCKQYADTLNVPFKEAKLADYIHGIKANGSREEIARKARRRFFEDIAFEYGARSIALGHHADDQQETFFIRLMRGASLTGLTSIRPRNGLYIHPLLQTRKQEIIAYLMQQDIPYLQDASNDSHAFLRNRIRHIVIPALRACDTRFDHTFFQTLTRLQSAEAALEDETSRLYAHAYDNGLLCVQKLLAQSPELRTRLLLIWLTNTGVPFTPSEALFAELFRFLESPRGGVHNVHPHWSIRKNKGYASIVQNKVAESL